MTYIACLIGGFALGIIAMALSWLLHERQNAKFTTSPRRRPISQPRSPDGRFASPKTTMTEALRRDVEASRKAKA